MYHTSIPAARISRIIYNNNNMTMLYINECPNIPTNAAVCIKYPHVGKYNFIQSDSPKILITGHHRYLVLIIIIEPIIF